MFIKDLPKTVSLKTIRKLILFCFFLFQFQNSYNQDLAISSIWCTSAYTTCTDNGASLAIYKVFLSLHSGLVLGSPHETNGVGAMKKQQLFLMEGLGMLTL